MSLSENWPNSQIDVWILMLCLNCSPLHKWKSLLDFVICQVNKYHIAISQSQFILLNLRKFRDIHVTYCFIIEITTPCLIFKELTMDFFSGEGKPINHSQKHEKKKMYINRNKIAKSPVELLTKYKKREIWQVSFLAML